MTVNIAETAAMLMPRAPSLSAPAVVRRQWSMNQIDTMRRTIAKDANDDELKMFLEFCAIKRLDPFTKQAILVIYNKHPRAKSPRQATIIVTQDGMRVIAARCGDYHPAKPGDTEYVLTAYQIERQRLLDEAAKIFVRSEREARLIEIHVNMPPDASNPAGIETCRTILWKNNSPVAGEAYWGEFAPLKPDPRCFTQIDTGETWPDGNPKKIKQLKPGINLAEHMILDDSGLWASKPRLMIHKCASVAGLKAGWPEEMSGVNAEEAMEKTVLADMTASELIDIGEHEHRLKQIGQVKNSYEFSDHTGTLVSVPAGDFADFVVRTAKALKYKDDLVGMRSRNRAILHRFWADHKSDALEVKAELENIAATLPDRPKPLLEVGASAGLI